MLNEKALDRFWAKVEKTEQCWNWRGCINSGGYGGFSFLGEWEKAHRVSWIIHIGPIPNGLCVLHSCDNRRCVHPDHLWLGTKADNNADKTKKGRARGAPWYRNGATKLIPEQVRKIRLLRAMGLSTYRLAERFGVSQRNICSILNGETWQTIS